MLFGGRCAFIIVALVVMSGVAHAGNLHVSWTAPFENEDSSPLLDLAGYRMYYGSANAPCPGSRYAEIVSATPSPRPNQTVSAILTGLAAGTAYHVSVTAVDDEGNESPCLTPVESAVARSDVSLSPTGTVNFGTASVGGFADRVFTVRNVSGAPISGAVSPSSGPFRVVYGSPFKLAPGAMQPVTLRFSPTVAATARGNITFTTSGGDSVSSPLVATGAPATPPPATAPPTIRVTGMSTAGSLLTLTGTASGTALTHVVWGRLGGKTGWATGTTNWTAAIPLGTGKNVMSATVWDAAGNHTTIEVQIVDWK